MRAYNYLNLHDAQRLENFYVAQAKGVQHPDQLSVSERLIREVLLLDNLGLQATAGGVRHAMDQHRSALITQVEACEYLCPTEKDWLREKGQGPISDHLRHLDGEYAWLTEVHDGSLFRGPVALAFNHVSDEDYQRYKACNNEFIALCNRAAAGCVTDRLLWTENLPEYRRLRWLATKKYEPRAAFFYGASLPSRLQQDLDAWVERALGTVREMVVSAHCGIPYMTCVSARLVATSLQVAARHMGSKQRFDPCWYLITDQVTGNGIITEL